jgi:hypothetical protein
MNAKHLLACCISVVLLFHCTGCSHTLSASCKYGSPCVATLPCPVSLSLSKEYCEYQHRTPGVIMVQHEFEVSYGPALREYAIYVARSVFGDVQVLDGDSTPRNESTILLKPKVISSNLQPPIGGLDSATGALGVQWSFLDPKTGQLLFGMPIQCEYRAKYSLWGNNRSMSTVADALMEELGSTTIQRFSTSKEVQRLSGH